MIRRTALVFTLLLLVAACRTHSDNSATANAPGLQNSSVDRLLSTPAGVDQIIAKLRRHPDAMQRVASAIAADPDRTREVVSQISTNPKTSPELVRQCISLVNIKAASPPTTVVPAAAVK